MVALIKNALNTEKGTGIYKIKLHALASSLISKTERKEISEFLRANPDIFSQDFSAIRSANYSTTTAYNKNEAAAFDLSIINELSKKNDDVLTSATQAINKDFKRMCKKYSTKIASFQSSQNPLEDSDSIEGKVELPSNFSFTLGSKNIPVLSLPKTKNDNQSGPPQESRREVEEVEEVEVITERLD